MKKFEFKLQKLLEIRQKKEDEEKLELARASGDYQLSINQKEKILSTVKEYRKSLSDNSGKLDASRLRAFDQYLKNSDFAVVELDVTIAEKRAIMEKHIQIYSELKKDRRAVEILKEKALERYKEEERKEEQSMLDDVGRDIYLKNNNSGNQRGGYS